jgi:hypothetical protein
MAANIFGERFLGRDKPAWHQIGTVFTGDKLVVDAVSESKLDYSVILSPLMATMSTILGKITVPVVGKQAIVREATADDPENRIFGVVGDDYKIIQNTELAQMLDSLLPDYKLETIGALGKGETIFYVLRLPGDEEIAGDQIKQYFLVTDTKDGKTALRIAFTPVRTVCQNTLVSGLNAATVKVGLSHTDDLTYNLDFRLNLLGKLDKAQRDTMDTFGKLAEVIIKMPSVDKILESAYPIPGKPAKVELLDENPGWFEGRTDLREHLSDVNQQWLYYCKLAQTRREEAKNRLEKLNDEFPKIARTPWAVWQACVENEDFRDGPESMYASAIFGDRAKTKIRAFNKCLEYIK